MIEVVAVKLIGPVAAAATLADEFDNAPPDDTPVPANDKPLNKLLPFRSIDAPLATVADPVPKAELVIEPTAPTEATFTLSVPDETVAPPEYVLDPDKVKTPAPDLIKEPPALVSAVAQVTFWLLVSTLYAWLAAVLKRDE